MAHSAMERRGLARLPGHEAPRITSCRSLKPPLHAALFLDASSEEAQAFGGVHVHVASEAVEEEQFGFHDCIPFRLFQPSGWSGRVSFGMVLREPLDHLPASLELLPGESFHPAKEQLPSLSVA